MISFESFEKLLINAGGKFVNYDRNGFSRRIKVDCLGTDVVFEWWKNCCCAYIGIIKICQFDNITINGCFPNRFKLNIEGLKDGVSMAVFPIEEYTS